MKRRHLNRKLKIVIPTVALVALLGGGILTYLYVQNAKTVAATSEQSDMRAAQASVQAVTDFYTQYMAVTTYAQSDYEQVIRHYGTPSLLAYYKAHTDGPDPITCAQFAPDSVKVRGTKDIVKMDATFSDGPALNGVTLKIVNQNGPKVDTVACPEYPNNS